MSFSSRYKKQFSDNYLLSYQLKIVVTRNSCVYFNKMSKKKEKSISRKINKTSTASRYNGFKYNQIYCYFFLIKKN